MALSRRVVVEPNPAGREVADLAHRLDITSLGVGLRRRGHGAACYYKVKRETHHNRASLAFLGSHLYREFAHVVVRYLEAIDQVSRVIGGRKYRIPYVLDVVSVTSADIVRASVTLSISGMPILTSKVLENLIVDAAEYD